MVAPGFQVALMIAGMGCNRGFIFLNVSVCRVGHIADSLHLGLKLGFSAVRFA